MIYVGSATFIIGLLLYFYFNNEQKNIDETCTMDMSKTAYEVKMQIMDSHMKKLPFIPKDSSNEHIKMGLYDKDFKKVYSSLQDEKDLDFTKDMFENTNFNYHIEKINDPSIAIKYIVIESCAGKIGKRNLKLIMIALLIASAIFVAFVAYSLARLLLKPVREKIEHMDNFIKDSAHELNTPVSVLLTSVSTLKQGRNQEKMMKYILSSSKQISEIYNDIHFSAFNELNENVNEVLELDVQIQESVDFLTDIANAKSITIETDLEATPIYMDRTKSQKLINNLVSNAIKYSNRDSKIIVTLKENLFCVQDFGIGISEQDQQEIFKRYKRSGKNNEGGFGIGLDIVSRINHEYGLKLSLESKPKVGSTFCIDFSATIKSC